MFEEKIQTSDNEPNKPYHTIMFILLMIAGLAGNYFRFSILNAHFIFGSIFTMLALQFLGLARGVIAAAVISGYTYFAWNHPYAVITMTGEVVAAGWLYSRRKINLPVADAIYWLLVGIPLGYFCFHIIGGLPSGNSLFLLTKQAINGIANALIARLIFSLYLLHFGASLISFREIITNLLALFVLCTAITMLAVSGRSDLAETDRHIRSSLLRDSLRVSDHLENWVQNRRVFVSHLADLASVHSPEDIQDHLDAIRLSDLNFLRIAVIDRDAVAIAYSPKVDEQGRPNIGKSFADRPYIPALRQTLKPMLSDIMVSKYETPTPVAIMLAPIVADGTYAGAAGGILNFDRIKSILDINVDGKDMRYALLDKNSRVIISNGKDQKVMSPFTRPSGKIERADNNIFQWIPELPLNTSTIELWGKSLYFAESAIGNMAEWRLILEQPVSPFQKKLYDAYIGRFTLIFFILLGSLAMAEFLSRQIVFTTEHLRQISYDLPRRLATQEQIDWPRSVILETGNLIGNFKEMAENMSSMFAEIRHMNESLEDTVRERTESLRKSEEDYRKLFEDHAAVKLIIDPATGNITDANQAAAAFYGWSRDQLRQMNIRQINTLSSEKVSTLMQNARKQENIHFEFSHRRADGSVRDVEVFSSNVRIKGGDYLHSIIHDITDRKKSEEENRNLQNQLTQAQKMESVGRLAGGVAHDFNNMLSIIIGYAEMALDVLEPSHPVYHNIQEILSAALRSADVVRHLLAFARKQTIDPKVLELNDVVSGLIKMLRRLIGEDIDLFWKPGDHLWQVKMDPSQIDQIMANLVVNARDAIRDVGKITIETSNVRFDEEYCRTHVGFLPGEYVLLAVSDNGCGMDKETQTKIFEPFFTTKEIGKGTGLGLATIYGIVKQNQGFINLYSEPGEGSLFKIYIPRCAPSEIEATKPAQSAKHLSGGETILLVEDEQIILNLGKMMLEHLGYRALTADSPDQAFRIAEEYHSEIHLLITDVVMPEMNGRDLADRLHTLYPKIRCLFMSGYTANVIAHHGVLEKGMHFIQKPFSKNDLAAKIRDVLQ